MQTFARQPPEINVTPLVDVCLVHLIIFLVVSAGTQVGDRPPPPMKSPDPGPALGSS